MAINLKLNLGKEDQEKLVLTVLLALVLAVATCFLLFGPGFKRLGDIRRQLVETRTKVEDARQLMENQARVQRLSREATSRLQAAGQWIPLETDSGWILQLISDIAKIQQIRTLGIAPQKEEEGEEQSGFFRLATCQVQLKTDYHSLGHFVDALERKSPNYRIKDLSIESSLDDPTRHEVTLKLQYLVARQGREKPPVQPAAAVVP